MMKDWLWSQVLLWALLFPNAFIVHAYLKSNAYLHNMQQFPFLILPGFGNSASDYTPPVATSDHRDSLVTSLKNYGFETVEVLPIKRLDWMHMTKAMKSVHFWTSSCNPDLLFEFYLQNMKEKINELNKRTNKPVVLVGHSAGGWLARAIIGNGLIGKGKIAVHPTQVAGLITLGSPQYPPSYGAPDPSRGALTFVSENYHPSIIASSGIPITTVAGAAIFGDDAAFVGSPEKLAAVSYGKVTGKTDNFGEEIGDGIVPVSHAHLDGASKITVEDTWHLKMGQSTLWYGSERVVDEWLPPATDHLFQDYGKESAPLNKRRTLSLAR